MNLLGAKLYDPSTAVSKATSALLAMTAFDTANLRIAFTIPSHGFVRVRLRCSISGATTTPAILLGVMNGATVIGRIAPNMFIGTASLATMRAQADAEFTITGLTPGAVSWDAAYSVEVIVASTNIQYGGPNNTTTNDAWGGFVFEVWDPQPLPTAAPGTSTGLLLAGSNAANITAIKAQTDQLNFGVTKQLDVNVMSVKKESLNNMLTDKYGIKQPV